MTRFNGSKRVKVGMNDANSSTGIQASTSTTAASFTGSVFGSMGRKVESHPVPLTAGQIASEEKRRSKEEKRVSKEKEQEKRNRERKRMEGKLLKGDTEASQLAKKYREQTILHWSIRDFVGNKESWDELRKKARRMGIVKKGLKRKVDKDWAEKLCRN
ncbi:hypothetical protein TrRE_jg10587 [Triparma retinervis]|uniref:Uncharacterized protein n=1 Tax=Triparma retinervis TaxID=2557542 RepID=A0A9W7AHB2_9STRA|nr:hypothetical protein TrRE_jg10587 [Triparma retinervis]